MNPAVKTKILNALLIVTSLFGYLEWGTDNRVFLFEAEAQIILKFLNHPQSVLHPFTVLPLVGQLLLVLTLFQKKPSKFLTYSGMGGIGVLLLMMFVIGLIGFNGKILLSSLPFLAVSVLTIRHNLQHR